jgi:hypothetical protein
VIGLDLFYYWNLTPKQFKKHFEAYKLLQEAEAREADARNHVLGQYIGMAVNAPKKYPREPFLKKHRTPEQMTPEEMEKKVEKYNKLLGGTINHGNK